jgi:anaerobic selenocysteine-containing dehydrogenase
MQRFGPPRVDAYAGRLAGLDTALSAINAIDTSSLEAETGIAKQTVTQVASEFLAAPRAVAYGRMGVSVQPWGTLCQYLLQLVNLVSGNLDRVGGALPNEPAIPITAPGSNPGTHARWRSRVRRLPEFAGELPVACMVEEIATPGDGQIRALLTCAGNPVLSTPDGRGLDRALESLEFMVAIDIYINETTRHADLILPPASPLTQDHYDSIFNAFAVRRVARLNRALHPRGGDERADWEIINGLGAAYAASAGKPWQPLPPPRDMIAIGLARGDSGLDLAALDAAPHGLDLGPLRPSLLARPQTASGCIECAPPALLAELDRFAARERSDIADDGLRLIGRREVRSNNSWMHNAPRLAKGKPRHHLLMHPDDMTARGLQDGVRVAVRSRIGEIQTEVLGDAGLMPGVACLPHGFGHGRDGIQLARASTLAGESYNDLTDPLAIEGGCGNAALNALPIEVEALP